VKKPTDEEIIKRAEERFGPCKAYWERHHQRFTKAVKFTKAHGTNAQWEEAEVVARNACTPPRLTLTENLLGPFCNQVVNDLKQSDFGAQVKPKDSGSDPRLAKVRQGLHRGIQQIGGFKLALDKQADDLVHGGLGAMRFITRRADPKSFRKEIEYLELDPTRLFHGDGNHRRADFRDVVDSFIYEPYSEDRFKAEFDMDPKTFLGKSGCNALWGSAATVPWVVEYFFKEDIADKLVMYEGKEYFLSEFREKFQDHAKSLGMKVEDLIDLDLEGNPIIEDTTRCQIWWAKMAGQKVLKVEAWPGLFIPVFLATGREVTVNGEKDYYGLPEPAFHVQKAHNYAFSAMVERAGLAPKVRTYAAWESIPAQFRADWDNLNDSNKSVAYYHAFDEQGNALPAPRDSSPIQTDPAFANLREMTIGGIKDTLGMWESSLGAQSQERSGIAIQTRERQSDTGNYDWGANLARSAELCFMATDEILSKVIDVPTQVRIVGEDDKEEVIWAASLEEGEEDNGYFNLNRGKYDILCRMAPSNDTKREEQSQGMAVLFEGDPQMKVALAPEWIALQDWKNADKISKIAAAVRAMAMPGLKLEDDQQQNIPPEVMQQMQQMQAQMQQMQQALQEMGPENEKLKIQLTAAQADKEIERERVNIERFKAEVEAQSKGVDATVKQGTLVLKADEQQHEQQMDRVGLQMDAQAAQHGQEKDGAEFRLKVGQQAHQMDKDGKAHQLAGQKLKQDSKRLAQKPSPTGGKPGTPSNRGR
jgi:hypothetical protein